MLNSQGASFNRNAAVQRILKSQWEQLPDSAKTQNFGLCGFNMCPANSIMSEKEHMLQSLSDEQIMELDKRNSNQNFEKVAKDFGLEDNDDNSQEGNKLNTYEFDLGEQNNDYKKLKININYNGESIF